MRTLSPVVLSLALSVSALGCDANPELESSEAAATVAPSFELFQDQSDEFRWNLLASNQEVVLSSEGYQTRVGALNGMLSVLANAEFKSAFQVKTADSGEFYFVLKAANGQVIGTSEMYSTKSNAKVGVQAVRAAAKGFSKIANKATGAGFHRFIGEDGQFYFHLKAANGEITLQSEGYTSEAAAWNGSIAVVEGIDAGRIELRDSEDGQVYFVVKAANGEVVAVSETYPTATIAKSSLSSVKSLLKTVQPL